MNNRLHFDTGIQDGMIDQLTKERESIGFYDLCLQDTQPYKTFAANVTQQEVVVVGIGGSALGASAVYKFINLANPLEKKLHILDTTDPLVLHHELEEINRDDAYYCIVSKSGTTVETIAFFKYLYEHGYVTQANCCIITDEGSVLEDLAKSEGYPYFNIPENVGGRFSVLSAVGLVPLAMVGVDIDGLLGGACQVRNDFFSGGAFAETLMKKATYYAQGSKAYNINCLFSYSEVFREFNAWYVQLWGESLGKQQRNSELHVGMTPVGLIGPTDQHSFLQLIVEGPRDKTVTVIKIKDFHNELTIPDVTLKHLESLDILNGYRFSELINMQADSIIESLERLERIPVDVIEIEQVDAAAIGKLIYYYELLTALIAQMLDINAYDQPGVEMGKIILKEKMRGSK